MSVELPVTEALNWLGQRTDRQGLRSCDRWVSVNRGRRRYLDLCALLASRTDAEAGPVSDRPADCRCRRSWTG